MPLRSDIDEISREFFHPQQHDDFNGLAMDLFHYQLAQNPIYARYVDNLGMDLKKLSSYEQIPFLPIEFFKSHKIVSGQFEEEIIFTSSGTSGMERSRHFVKSLELYSKSFMLGFEHFYGPASAIRFLGLLPSYLERDGSSLIYMVDKLIAAGAHPESGFYLDEFELLVKNLREISLHGFPTVLIGVSFALLDFAEKYKLPLGDNIIVMETGCMKGRREELTREELHSKLCDAFSISSIHSEYGMTELLSQAYSKGDGRFFTPPWMKVLIRDIQDPFSILDTGETGAINIIDLANMHSCSFIETQDIGRLHPDGSFEVLGRTDASDIRGCSLLLA